MPDQKSPRGDRYVVNTPIAKPVPTRPLITRRMFILGGFWSMLGLALIGTLCSPLNYVWPRKVAGGKITVPVAKDLIPKPGEDPKYITMGKFFLVNLEAGVTPNGEESPGGLLALFKKCPHLGCSVPWRPEFEFAGRKGWFRCPCHGSTYTKEGGIIVAGPAPRPMDRFEITVKEDGNLEVIAGTLGAIKGVKENPERTVPYPPNKNDSGKGED